MEKDENPAGSNGMNSGRSLQGRWSHNSAPREGLKRGELAKASGASLETVRFYETKGLIPEPPRTASGYRVYPGKTVERLLFIQNAKSLGFSLRQIRELLELRSEGAEDCHTVRDQVVQKIREVDYKMEELRRIRQSLEHLSHICNGRDPMNECPILDFLQQEREQADV